MLISRVWFNNLSREFNFKERISFDPLSFPHKYQDKKDVEVSGLISSVFAYGRVKLFMPVIERILGVMGRHPFEFILNLEKKDLKYFNDIYYRFQKVDDVKKLITVLSRLLRRYDSIEEIFMGFYDHHDNNVRNCIEGFSGLMISKKRVSSGYLQLFPLPSSGSACKRMNLFLRWMVRDKEPDLGIWKRIPKNKLVIPLDTHIARISIKLGFTSRKIPDWRMAEEITETLKLYDPEDPLKYDFVLCHMGMTGRI